jgi:hypothetical protein
MRSAFIILFLLCVGCRSTQVKGRETAAEIKVETGKVWELVANSTLPEEVKKAVKESLGKIDEKSTTLGEKVDEQAEDITELKEEVAENDFYFWLVRGLVGFAGACAVGYGTLKGSWLFKIVGGLATAAALFMGVKKVLF